ncbi:methionine ABC transporter ATP-binding protein [Clostridium sp. SYSU_GA19001]|uniref:methionine ABC transporter ATP-binding protein n=1 Tax=Clostridium caldaquaticum TaxID=2940653 RepID=UPI0020773ABF|nr:methionine ABC transporter ATP-binding protein [Clostridium caldaquaticum]MCM8711665.1 methionine ABC transporter ATP-binding protein [Clostridium caldaquaticum]
MISIRNVSKSFSGTKVLNSVSFNIAQGEIFGIVGHSGAGKSTLLRCLNGLESYDKGSIVVMNKEVKDLTSNELREFRKELGMIFQSFNLLNRLSVYENVALPLELWGFSKDEIKERVYNLLNLVGLSEKVNNYPRELSGGQKQRVAIARALALQPKILLCDEATSALDPKTTKSILQLLKEINQKLNITIVIVTHQMEVIKEACNRVALMEGGVVKALGGVEELFLKPTDELKDLMGEEDVLPKEGVNIKIFFPKETSQRSIITSMARELNIDFSIVWGRLEKFREDVLGSLVINVCEQDEERIFEFLDKQSVSWEVIRNVD